jgi:hypothetical protein
VSKGRLERSLDKYGCIEPILVQRSTGHVLSGHQRLAWMDKEADGGDYEVLVSFVDLGDKEAEALMVHLNNPAAQGDWDLPRLELLLLDLDDLLPDTSFDHLSLELLFPETPEFGKLFNDTPDALEKAVADIQETKRVSSDSRKKANEQARAKNDPEYYLVVVFDSVEKKRGFCREIGVPENERYISGKRLLSRQAGRERPAADVVAPPARRG